MHVAGSVMIHCSYMDKEDVRHIYIYMSHIFFIHSSGDGHWVISITWVVFLIVNNAAIKVVCVYFQLSIFLFVCLYFHIYAHEWNCWIIW